VDLISSHPYNIRMLNEKVKGNEMQVTVFHRGEDSNEMVRVAVIDAGKRDLNAALNYAFFRTQNIDGSWSRPATFEFNGQMVSNSDFSEDTLVVAELPVYNGNVYGLRSTMVGDVFFADGKRFEVDFTGFKGN